MSKLPLSDNLTGVSPLTAESVHDAWLSQRAELESELFDGWVPTITAASVRSVQAAPKPATPVVARPKAVTPPTLQKPPTPTTHTRSAKPTVSVVKIEPQHFERVSHATQPIAISLPHSPRRANLEQQDEAALKQRFAQQASLEQELAQQREAFQQELDQQRAALEQELSARESAWVEQRDKEWASLRHAQEVQEASLQQLQQEMAEERVREREELLAWRRQAEAELAEARRLFEQERMKQQQEFARQRDTELSRLRCEREDLDSRLRVAQAELSNSRQNQELELRVRRDAQDKQLQTERAELEQLRESWLDKFRREQVVLENGMRFFEEHLSRVSDELRTAQRGLQAVTVSAAEATPRLPFERPSESTPSQNAPSPLTLEANLPTTAATSESPPAGAALLSLEEIRDRLRQLKQPERQAA